MESEWKEDETAPRKNYDEIYVICVQQNQNRGIFPSNAETICYVVKTQNLIQNFHSIVCCVLRIQFSTLMIGRKMKKADNERNNEIKKKEKRKTKAR